MPKALPKGSLGAGMIVSVILPETFWQSARAWVAVPNTARHNASVTSVLLFMVHLLFVLI
jgi:hypothetical protein